MERLKKTQIAIVGVGFRLPKNINTLDTLWDVLCSGDNLISEVDENRFDFRKHYHTKKTELGKSYTFKAGMLSDIHHFDAQFFGISPREALQMDPQQRLLLEVTWEALENGGQHIDNLRGKRCAVYVGVGSNENTYQYVNDFSSIDSYMMPGNCTSIASNRLSYFFNFQGPSMSIDTACSSSLVALHQACESIRSGDVPMAIAGGVNLLQSPASFIGFSKASMLSPDGQCKSFSAAANGYVRSEGCVVLFLKSLKDAERDGDPIYAVIANSGVNNDGRTNGIVLPSADAQAALITRVHDQAGISPDDISYIEAHGTGTLAGDHAESQGLCKSISKKRSNPLLIGSIKSNLGHLEVASGLTGLLKTILCLQHKKIPKTLHFDQPNPNIPFNDMKLKVVDALTDIPVQDKPLMMGVNSFGFGGTNAHVVLREFIPAKNKKAVKNKNKIPPLWLSLNDAKNESELFKHYLELIRENKDSYYDIAHAAFYRKAKHPHGIAITGDSVEDIIQALNEALDNNTHPNIARQDRLGECLPVALVYSGNGSQWQGMGVELIHSDPVFKKTIREIDALFSAYSNFSIKKELLASLEKSRYEETEIAQPCLFALQVATTRYLLAHGLKIAAVTGHSVGEIAAAWASGALTLAQATEVIYQRSFWQGKTCGQGRMMAVGLSADNAQTVIDENNLQNDIVVAAINAAESVTLAGDLSALKILETICADKRILHKLLDLDYAFHTKAMNPIKDRLIDSLNNLQPKKTNITYVSTVTGDVLSGDALHADYWWRNIREPVQFHQAINTLIQQEIRVFIEVGPHAVLKNYVEATLKSENVSAVVLSTGRRKLNQLTELHQGLFKAWLCGADFNHGYFFPHPGKHIQLPTQIWSKEYFRLPSSSEDTSQINLKKDHPLLGWRIKKNESIWENHLDSDIVAYLADHVVNETTIFPAAGFCEMAMAASRVQYDNVVHDVRDLEILSPLVFDDAHARQVRFELMSDSGDFTIKSRQRHMDEEWRLHAVGHVIPAPALIEPQERIDCDMLQKNAVFQLPGHALYAMANRIGLVYGPMFQPISAIGMSESEAIATLTLSSEMAVQLPIHCVYPGILDACFQVLIGLLSVSATDNDAFLPVRVGRLTQYHPLQNNMVISAHISKRSKQSVLSDFIIADKNGIVLVRAEECRFKKAHFTDEAKQSIYINKPHLLESFTTQSVMHFNEIQSIQNTAFQVDAVDRIAEISPLIDLMVVYFIYDAVTTLSAEKTFSLDVLVEQSLLDPKKMPFLKWCLSVLEENHLIVREAQNTFTLLSPENQVDSVAVWQQVLAAHPRYLTEILFVGRVGMHLKNSWGIDTDNVLELRELFSQDSLNYFIDNAPSLSCINTGVLSVFSSLLEKKYADQKIRILDIGASISDLSIKFLNACSFDQTEYLLLVKDDAGKVSLDNYPHLTIKTLSPDSWVEDFATFSENQFDLILVRNYLHTVKNTHQHVSLLKKHLSNDGVLFFMGSPSHYLQDFICGLDDAWWRQSQAGEVYSPLMSSTEWKALLQKNGFSVSDPSVERGGSDREGMFLLLAQPKNEFAADVDIKAKSSDSTVLCIADDVHPLKAILSGIARHSMVVPLLLPKHFPEATRASFFHDALEPYAKNIDPLRIVWFFNETSLSVAEAYCSDVVSQLKSLSELKWSVPPQLFLVTQQRDVRDQTFNPAQSLLLGLGRVIQNEYKELNCKLIDVRGASITECSDHLIAEIFNADDERDVVITPSARYGLRVESINPFVEKSNRSSAYCLDFKRSGSLKNLCWSPVAVVPLASDEVRIAPRATGLNFRDLMYAMGLIPDEAVENGFLGATLGMEFSGDVLEVGADVADFKVGDRVMGFSPASFSTMAVTKAHAITQLPSQWCYEEAATIPIAFFTAYYALHHLARLQPGERVLIHGAAGGVGIAAIQIANHIGATVFATAGSASKQDFLSLSGIVHRYDSRSLQFADEILRDTQGKGVDVILNCLAGEAIAANLSIIKPFGRFLELGKRDFFANSKMGLRPFRNNISYFGIDADQLLMVNPKLCVSLFREMMGLFESGALTPLPYRVFETKNIDDTFRYMQQSRHIGKVVVRINESELQNTLSQQRVLPELKLSSEASYLITGGLRGFGLETAKWLVTKGARHLILVGRGAVADEETRHWIQEMQMNSVVVRPYACDVSDAIAIQQMMASVANDLPPLKGVIHAAAVYDDALIQSLDDDKIKTVIQPKAMGAWNLHVSTQNLCLDFFVVYSSVTTLFGNPGQANYVAANTYLENLIDYRRSIGLPGLFVAWGPIADAGYLARNEKIKNMLANKLGEQLLTAKDAFLYLEKLWMLNITGASVANLNLRKMSRSIPVLSTPKFQYLVNHDELLSNTVSDASEDIRILIADKTDAESVAIIGDILLSEIAKILRLPVEKMDKKTQLIHYGMDSLVGVELAHAISDRFSIQMPMMSLSQGVSVDAISERVFAQLRDPQDQSTESNKVIAGELMLHGEQISDEMKKVIESEIQSAVGAA